MKKHTKKLTKMQRKVRARRKTWTRAEQFANKAKNARRLLVLAGGHKLAKKFIAEAEQELAQEMSHDHKAEDQPHDHNTDHEHVHDTMHTHAHHGEKHEAP